MSDEIKHGSVHSRRGSLRAGYKLGGYIIEGVLRADEFEISYVASSRERDGSVSRMVVKELMPVSLVERLADGAVEPYSGHKRLSWTNLVDDYLARAKILARCRHPSLERILDGFRHNGTAYLIVQFEEGDTLEKDRQRRGRPPTQSQLDALLTPLLEALEQAHARGFIHGHIQPDNIQISQPTRPLLLDCGGRAVVLAESFRIGETVLLRDKYGPLEEGKPRQGPWTDLYALAAVIHELITGEPPPAAKERVAATTDPYQPLTRRLSDRYSRSFLACIDRALRRDPRERPQSASEWAQAHHSGEEKTALGASRTAPQIEVLENFEASTATGAGPSPPQSVFDDDVQFTVWRPQTMVPAQWATWLAFAHRGARIPGEPDYAEEVESQARAVLGTKFEEYASGRQESGAALPRESTITIVPTVDGVEFNPPQRSFVWRDPVHREEFLARVRARADAGVRRGKVTFFLGALIVAEINVKVSIGAGASLAGSGVNAAPITADRASAYRQIFASYSRRDRAIVQQFERLIAAFGDRYLRDVHTLRAGEEWGPGLERMIREADVFQLFWSSNSMRSPYVRQEWEYALGLGRANFVRPTYWEDPLPGDPSANLPPETLCRLHFQRLPMNATPQVTRPPDPNGTTWLGSAEITSEPDLDAGGCDAAYDEPTVRLSSSPETPPLKTPMPASAPPPPPASPPSHSRPPASAASAPTEPPRKLPAAAPNRAPAAYSPPPSSRAGPSPPAKKPAAKKQSGDREPPSRASMPPPPPRRPDPEAFAPVRGSAPCAAPPRAPASRSQLLPMVLSMASLLAVLIVATAFLIPGKTVHPDDPHIPLPPPPLIGTPTPVPTSPPPHTPPLKDFNFQQSPIHR